MHKLYIPIIVFFVSLIALGMAGEVDASSTAYMEFDIMQHPNGEYYFHPAPTKCLPQTWVTIKIVNKTKSTVGLLMDGRPLADDNPPILHPGHSTVNAINTVAAPSLLFTVSHGKHKNNIVVSVCQ